MDTRHSPLARHYVSRIQDLLGGRTRGLGPSLLRAALTVAELPYACAVRWRNRSYDRGAKAVERVGVPVVSVGNITTGGTGKTPLVAWIARHYRDRSLRVGLVSRGYKPHEGARNDEALELEERLPDVPHVQNPDRVAGAQLAIEEFESQLILLDDAFQHRRIHRDLDLVLLDALMPFGFGHVLPRGLLREPLAGLRRASALILTRRDAVDEARRDAIRREALRHAGDVPWIEASHQPLALVASGNRDQPPPLSWLRGRRVAAFCGVGNPDGFRHTLKELGGEIAGLREFPDHHPYSAEDVERLEHWLVELGGVEAILCTDKDLVKLRVPRLGSTPLYAVRIGVRIDVGEETLRGMLDGACS